MRNRYLLRPRPMFRLGAAALLFLCLGATSPAASKDTAKWDQEQVTKLAVELAVTTRGLRREVRRSIPDNRATTRVHTRNRLLDHLRVLQNETRFLAAELEAGQGMAETLPSAQRIDRIVDRAVVDGRRLFLPKPVLQKIERANELLDELRPFYGNYQAPEEPDS
jgi:hypothetical protein